jgi:hypothetical protein
MRSRRRISCRRLGISLLAALSAATLVGSASAETPAAVDDADLRVPASIVAMATGGLALAGGLAEPPGDEEPVEVCGLSGCADFARPTGDPTWHDAFVVGGATTLASGTGLLLLSALDQREPASAARGRTAAGGLVTSLGLGITALGITRMAQVPGDSQGQGAMAMGLVTTAVGAPFFVWGVLDDTPPEVGATHQGKGAFLAGSILTAGGVASAGAVVVVASADCQGGQCLGQAVTGVFALGCAAVGLGSGIPLMAYGGSVDAAPTVGLGAGNASLTWRLP